MTKRSAFALGLLIAVGMAATGAPLAAQPLDTWTMIQQNIASNGINGMAWGSGRWLAASGDGLLSSEDGEKWRGVSHSRDHGIQSFAHADGQWVGVGRNFVRALCGGYEFWGGVFRSTDGLTWSGDLLREQGITFQRALVAVAHGGGRWIAVGGEYGRYVTSLDGLTWTPLVLGPFLSRDLYIRSVGYGNGTWVAAGEELGTTAIFTSSNGLDWTRRSMGAGFVRRVDYEDGQWVGVGGRNIWSSPDGITWTPRYTTPNADQFMNALAFGNGRWIVAGADAASSPAAGLLFTSTDANDWTPLRQDQFRAYTEVVFADNQWLVGGQVTTQVGSGWPSALLSSPDGAVWTDHTVISRKRHLSLHFADNRWVTTAGSIYPYEDGSTFNTSTDGLHWTSVDAPPGRELTSLAYGNGQWLAMGFYFDAQFQPRAVAFTSPDAAVWAERTAPVAAPVLAFGGGQWVAWGGAPPDYVARPYTADPATLTWTAHSTYPGFLIEALHFAAGQWVGTGTVDNGAGTGPPLIATSPDGVTWTRRPLDFPHGSLFSVTHADNQWVAVGDARIRIAECNNNFSSAAVVLTSPDGIHWTRRETGLPRGTTPFSPSGLTDITWTGDEWVAVGAFDRTLDSRAMILTSPDAVTWTIQPSITGKAQGLWRAAFGNGRVVVANDNILQVSAPILPRPPVLGIERVGNDVWLLLTGKPGRTYAIEESSPPAAPPWATIRTLTLDAPSQRIPVAPAPGGNTLWRARAR